nr:hypothetical protein [Cytophagales bacterium]
MRLSYLLVSMLLVFSLTMYDVRSMGMVTPDLEASEVICHTTDTGERYFSYLVRNVGNETAPAGSYQVFFKVNGKLISFERTTDTLQPGKSILYTSEHKFYPNQKKRVLKYNLIINTKDADRDNNKKTGEIWLDSN